MDVEVHSYGKDNVEPQLSRWESYVTRYGYVPLSRHPSWGLALGHGLQQTPYWLEARRGGQMCGLVVVSHVRSLLFGRFLVSLPYLNYGGILADDVGAARVLVNRAVELAELLDVRYLELRQEHAIPHPDLAQGSVGKVNMRLALPQTAEQLWKELSAKVRNQIRKAQRCMLTVRWGREELLDDFYSVFSQNMHDLGTPAYGRELFQSALAHFSERTEIAVVYCGPEAVAAALCMHGWGVTEVPSASALRRSRYTNANMLLYWRLLQRAIEREQAVFDFGRCTPQSNVFRFKKQWGATAQQTQWQYYLREGNLGDMRIENPKYERFIRMWQRLPVGLTRWIGPRIVRGIP
jgi:FemAB-related protein (PEP-CTERM system-associated)